MTRDGSYRVFDHTADIGLAISAPSMEELFETAGVALFDLLADVGEVAPVVERHVRVDDAGTTDSAELLVRWLSELLYLHETEELLFCRFTILSMQPGRLEAIAAGETRDPLRHHLKREVKAITYHQASVQRDAQGWTARVICDI